MKKLTLFTVLIALLAITSCKKEDKQVLYTTANKELIPIQHQHGNIVQSLRRTHMYLTCNYYRILCLNTEF